MVCILAQSTLRCCELTAVTLFVTWGFIGEFETGYVN